MRIRHAVMRRRGATGTAFAGPSTQSCVGLKSRSNSIEIVGNAVGGWASIDLQRRDPAPAQDRRTGRMRATSRQVQRSSPSRRRCASAAGNRTARAARVCRRPTCRRPAPAASNPAAAMQGRTLRGTGRDAATTNLSRDRGQSPATKQILRKPGLPGLRERSGKQTGKRIAEQQRFFCQYSRRKSMRHAEWRQLRCIDFDGGMWFTSCHGVLSLPEMWGGPGPTTVAILTECGGSRPTLRQIRRASCSARPV